MDHGPTVRSDITISSPGVSTSPRRWTWLPSAMRDEPVMEPPVAGSNGRIRSRAKIMFANRFNRITSVRPFASKILLSFFQNLCSLDPVLCPIKRGASRSSRTLGAGCGGRVGLQHDCRADEQHDTHGEIVWSWHPGADACATRQRCRNAMMLRITRTGARKPVPGEITYKPSKHRTGKAGCSARTCGSAACFFAARGPRVRPASGLPCALFLEEGDLI